jgi:valyl-tRNA synthetase
MIMLGCHFMLDMPMPDGSPRTLADAVPFRNVYIHALVRDANREKMSKTKGNVIDPIEIIERFGTDAVRFTLASMASPGTDIAFSEARTEGNRAFANKIWNAARFVFMNLDRAREAGIRIGSPQLNSAVWAEAPIETRWILGSLSDTCNDVDLALYEYRFDEAANAVYKFFWGKFCDWYLELVKVRLEFNGERNSAIELTLSALVTVFEAALRLLSPFMPFITEEIWHALYATVGTATPEKSIALSRFPVQGDYPPDGGAVTDMTLLVELIATIRAVRKEIGIPEKETAPIVFFTPNDHNGRLVSANVDMLTKMARVSALSLAQAPITGSNTKSAASFDVQVLYERTIDIPAERERLTKDLVKYEKGLIASDRQLSNESFMAKAPAHIVEGLRKQAAETRTLYDKTKAALEALT